jgi:hypothetical protein
MRGGESPRQWDSLRGSANWNHSLGLCMHPFVFGSSIYVRLWIPVRRSQIARTSVVMVSGAISLPSAYAMSFDQRAKRLATVAAQKAGANRIVVHVRNNLDRGRCARDGRSGRFLSSITSLARRGAQIVTVTASYQSLKWAFQMIMFVCCRSQARPRICHST